MPIGRDSVFANPQRREIKEFDGTPDFRYAIGAITSGTPVVVDLESVADVGGVVRAKYLPFDTITIDNVSTSVIIFRPNQSKGQEFKILANSSRTIFFRGMTSLWFDTVSGNTGATDVSVSISKAGMTANEYAKIQAKKSNVFTNFFGSIF